MNNPQPVKIESNNPKFIESYSLDDWQIETPDGWNDIAEIHKTIPFEKWQITTNKGKSLDCADDHWIINKDNECIYAKDSLDESITTKDGIEKVVSVDNLHTSDNMYDITLTNDSSHTYFTNDILSHNTTNMLVSADLYCRIIPGLRIATIVPRMEQLRTLGYKSKEIEQAFRFLPTKLNPKFKSNLYYKEYDHGKARMSLHRMYYVLSDASKLRSPTFDWINFDEYQDFDDSLERVIKATQSRSEFRQVTYGGTSKSVDTPLESKWLDSARGLWRMTCPACHFDNYPDLNHGVLDMIQPKGLCCKKCGRILNVRNGSWDFEAPEMLKLGKWGFHIPQIIVPANTEKQSIYLDIYLASKNADKKSFLEEYLGEATESGTKEITTRDLQNICILGDISDVQKRAVELPPKYIFKVSGCDWGGSDYNPAQKSKASYTAHCILGVTPSGHFDIIYMQKYAGMDYDDISHCIAHDHHRFGCCALGNDYGGNSVYVNELKKLMDPLKVILYKYKAQGTFLSIPKQSNMFNLYSLHRTDSITTLFMDVKNSRISAPRWEQVEGYLKDFLVLTRVPYENQQGVTGFLYTKQATKTDDMLHAVNYAICTAKLLLGESLFEDESSMELFRSYYKYGKDMRGILRNRHAEVTSLPGLRS